MSESTRMRLSAWFCAVLLLGLSPSALGDEGPMSYGEDEQPMDREEPVGDWGNPKQIEIQGAETFTPKAITDALLSNWNVVLAAHPSADLRQYACTLREATLAGYRNEGFPDAKVTIGERTAIGPEPDFKDGARRPSHLLKLTIEEGPRFACGKVRISGADRMGANRLVERLTRPYLPRDATSVRFDGIEGKTEATWVDRDGKDVELVGPVWQRGEPAPFADAARQQFRRRVTAAMADLGYHFAAFDVWVVPRQSKKRRTADLQIDIIDEGPKAEIARIEVEGNQKNSDEEIIEYLALEPGTVFDRQEQARLLQRLWRSGRFIRYFVEPQEPETKGESLWLKIDVTEYPEAPPLSQPLSPEEEAMLRLRDWLANPARWKSDMVLTAWHEDDPGKELEVTVSPEHGVAATYGNRHRRRGFDWALVAADGHAGFYSSARRSKLESELSLARVLAEIKLSMAEEPSDSERPYRQVTVFAAALTARGAPAGSPLRLKLRFDPCHFLAYIHEHDAKCEIRQGILTLEADGSVCRVEASSGRLIELDLRQQTEEPKVQSGLRIRLKKNAMVGQLRKIRTVSAGYANEFDARRPISSLLGFACRDTTAWKQLGFDARQLAALQIASSAIDAGVLGPLDDLSADATTNNNCATTNSNATKSDRENTFTIPGGLDGMGNVSASSLSSQGLWSRAAVMRADDLFPRQSWPWTVWRETALVVGGEPRYADRTLADLHDSESTGPLCLLTVASLLDRVHPNAAHKFAQQGLTRLLLDDFRNDYRPLLDDDFLLGKCVLHLATVLRDMDDQGVRAIAESLDAEDAKLFGQAVEVLRRERDRPIEEALGEVLDELWENGLRHRVKKALESIQPVELFPDSAVAEVCRKRVMNKEKRTTHQIRES